MNRKIFKKSCVIAFLISMISISNAQTLLPTSYSFDAGTPPNGWTLFLDVITGATTYSGGSDATPSCRLDGTGEYVQIDFLDEPDSLIYSIRATGTTPPASPGTTFTVQQSANGISWSTVRVFDTNNLTGSFVEFIDMLLSTTRHVRFFYTNKVSGSNIALDEIRIGKSDPGPPAAIAVFQGTTQIPNGGTIVVSNTGANTIEIRNEGTVNTLSISSNSLSGPAAADYSVSGMPGTILAGAASNFNLNFSPSQSGSRFATLNILSNDANDPVFSIEIYGISGGLASEPTQQANNLSFSNLSSFDYNYTFSSPASLPENFIVLRKTNTIVTEVPVDGTTYQAGDVIGGAEVEYVGPAGLFLPDYAYANTTYHYAVYAFNGPSGFENYLTSSPLTGAITTSNAMIGSYYSGVNCLSSGFINALTTKINPHNWIYYSNYSSTMIEEFEEHDTINGKKTVMCQYSGYDYMYDSPFQWDTMSREHVYSHSWFPTNPATNNIEYSDLHNLFPTQLNNVNIPRSNHPMGIVVSPTSVFHEGKLGLDNNGNTVYEPRDDIKGNVARAMFYMTVCYNGTGGFTWTLPASQDQQLLKDWHFQDLPDNYEIARNDYVYSVQGNRNPFVDSIHFACYIDFSTMTRINNPPSWCVVLGVDDITEPSGISVFPNPSDGLIRIESVNAIRELCVMDLKGSMILKPAMINNESAEWDLSGLEPGVYILKINSEERTQFKKLVLY